MTNLRKKHIRAFSEKTGMSHQAAVNALSPKKAQKERPSTLTTLYVTVGKSSRGGGFKDLFQKKFEEFFRKEPTLHLDTSKDVSFLFAGRYGEDFQGDFTDRGELRSPSILLARDKRYDIIDKALDLLLKQINAERQHACLHNMVGLEQVYAVWVSFYTLEGEESNPLSQDSKEYIAIENPLSTLTQRTTAFRTVVRSLEEAIEWHTLPGDTQDKAISALKEIEALVALEIQDHPRAPTTLAVIEKGMDLVRRSGKRVVRMWVNVVNYSDIRKLGRDIIDFEFLQVNLQKGILGRLMGMEIRCAWFIKPGTVVFIEDGHDADLEPGWEGDPSRMMEIAPKDGVFRIKRFPG